MGLEREQFVDKQDAQSIMKKRNLLPLFSAAVVAVTFAACDVDKTQEGEMPEVKVEGGQMPEYDVDVAEVEVGTTEKTVEVPKVVMEEETISVPVVGVDMPAEDGDGAAAEPAVEEDVVVEEAAVVEEAPAAAEETVVPAAEEAATPAAE